MAPDAKAKVVQYLCMCPPLQTSIYLESIWDLGVFRSRVESKSILIAHSIDCRGSPNNCNNV